jgi:hypothetical protein
MTDRWLKQIVRLNEKAIKENPTGLLLDGKNDRFAQELYTRIQQIDKHAFSYWGVTSYGALTTLEGLYLRIDGPKFRGIVKITPNQYDLFDIEIVQSPNNRTIERLESIHLEDIPRKLDSFLK